MNVIKIKDLYKTYKTKYNQTKALTGIDLEVDKGEFVMIVGKSGCGKATLLNVLGCMDGFDNGHYLYANQNIGAFNDKELSRFRNQNIGYIFQAFNLINEISVLENVELPMQFANKESSQSIKRKALEMLAIVGLEAKARSKPLELSGGQQQRVAIARSMVNMPDLLLCDEPTGNLDEENSDIIMEQLKVTHERGNTIIMVTHNLALIKYATKVYSMSDGKLSIDEEHIESKRGCQ